MWLSMRRSWACALLFIVGTVAATRRPSAQLSRVYGGGLDPHIITPARYIHIQAVDSSGRAITHSLGQDAFKASVSIKRKNGQAHDLKTVVMDRGDGTYSARYILNELPDTVTISVQLSDSLGGGHVGQSPFVLKGPHQVEQCNCPRTDIAAFETTWGCSASDPARQIDADLKPFKDKGGISKADIDDAIEYLNKNETCFIHYVIKNNAIYTKGYGKYQGFKKFLDDMLHSLSRKVKLPDAEFLLNLGDWPQVRRHDDEGTSQPARPVFAWSSSTKHWDMVLPTYKMTESCVFGKDLENIQEVDGKAFQHGGPWEKKIAKGFWRGRPCVQARTDAAQLSKKHPDVLDIAVTKNHFNYFPDEAARREHHEYEAKYGPKAERMSFNEFFKWKYQVNIDGTVAAYRLGSMLAGNSLAMVQDSDYYEHFYHALKPYEHYVPLNRSLDDLVEKVQWARAHDAEAKAMMQRARQFTRQHLRVEDIYCYYHLALRRYADLLTFPVVVRDGMELVKHEFNKCPCPDFSGTKVWSDAAIIGALLAAIGVLIFVLRRFASRSSSAGQSKPAKAVRKPGKQSKKTQ